MSSGAFADPLEGPMPRAPRSVNRFNQREVARAIRAAREAGENLDRVEIDPASGKISVFVAKPAAAESTAGAKTWNEATEAVAKSKQLPRSAPTRR
jgi:hypothetical protein